MVARVVARALDQEDDHAAKHERRGHDPGGEQVGLHEVVQQQAEHDRGQERDRNGEHEPARLGLARQVEQDPGEPAEVEQAHGQDGRELDDEDEDVEPLDRVAQKIAGEDQVASRRDRDELGHALDHAEDQRVEQVAVGQGPAPGRGTQVMAAGRPSPARRPMDGGGGAGCQPHLVPKRARPAPQDWAAARRDGRAATAGFAADPGDDVLEHALALVVAEQRCQPWR